MKKSGIKFAMLSSLSAALILVSCGGGGGDPGAPLFPPNYKLTMTPNIGGVTVALGNYMEPVKISGGQPPYYVGATGGVIPTMLDDGTLLIQAVAVDNTNTSSDGSPQSCSSSDYVWIQDSSYNQTELKFNVCVTSASLSTTLGSTPELTLSPGGSQTFTVYGGKGPYTASSSNVSVANVSSSGTNGTFVVTAGNNASTSGTTATIMVTDAVGATVSITVNNIIAKALAISPTSLSGMAGNAMTLSIVGGVAPYKAVSSNTTVATVLVNGASAAVSLVGAGSSNITVQDATESIVTATVTVTAAPGAFSVLPPTQTLSSVSGAANFLLLNGVGPYYVTAPTYTATQTSTTPGTPTDKLISVSPMVLTSTTTPVVVTSLACVKGDYTIPLTITDASSGASKTVRVQLLSDGTGPGCY